MMDVRFSQVSLAEITPTFQQHVRSLPSPIDSYICAQQGRRPIAGCWYYNHLSKKTLEKAGLFSQTRLLKFLY
jgi:hypothetical protein